MSSFRWKATVGLFACCALARAGLAQASAMPRAADATSAPSTAAPSATAPSAAASSTAAPSAPPRAVPEGSNGGSGLGDMLRSISLTGFAVAQSTARSQPGKTVDLTTIELDGTIELGQRLQGAVSFVRSGTVVEIPVGFLDVHFGGALIAPRGRIFAERGVHLQAGRFDLPFGGDWLRFAATDRGFSSAPAITDFINDGGLNDIGVRAYSVTARWNASAWVVRGALEGKAAGARVAITPFSNPFVFPAPAADRPLEIGVSTHVDTHAGDIADQRVALDVALRHGDAAIDAEWQQRRVRSAVQDLVPGTARGWHVSTELPAGSFGPVSLTLLARGEALRGDALGTDGLADAADFRRAAGGVRLTLGSWLIVKCELDWRLADPLDAGLQTRAWLIDAVVRW